MKTEELNRLLEKYYKGESTDGEEKILRMIFSGNNIPEGFDAEKVIFGYYMSQAEIPEPSDGFELEIQHRLNESEKIRKSPGMRKYIVFSLSTAAGLILLAGSYFFFADRHESSDTFTDPAIAYQETMKILMNISYKLNQGTRALEPVGRINEMSVKSFESISKSTKLVEKNLKNLGYLQKAIEITNIPDDKSRNN